MNPSWPRLDLLAEEQGGLFSASQARERGFSPQLLDVHLKNGRIRRLHRGIYQMIRSPASEQEELIMVWLWSLQEGIFGHRTALFLHGLSDVLPARIDVTLPRAWKRRTREPPAEIHRHYAENSKFVWIDCIPVSPPAQALLEGVEDGLGPDLVEQAVREGLNRGLFSLREIVPAIRKIKTGRD